MFRSRRRLSSALAGALAIGALAAPAANAVTGEEFRAGSAPQSTSAVGSGDGPDLYSTSALGSSNRTAAALPAPIAADPRSNPSSIVRLTVGAGTVGAGLLLDPRADVE